MGKKNNSDNSVFNDVQKWDKDIKKGKIKPDNRGDYRDRLRNEYIVARENEKRLEQKVQDDDDINGEYYDDNPIRKINNRISFERASEATNNAIDRIARLNMAEANHEAYIDNIANNKPNLYSPDSEDELIHGNDRVTAKQVKAVGNLMQAAENLQNAVEEESSNQPIISQASQVEQQQPQQVVQPTQQAQPQQVVAQPTQPQAAQEAEQAAQEEAQQQPQAAEQAQPTVAEEVEEQQAQEAEQEQEQEQTQQRTTQQRTPIKIQDRRTGEDVDAEMTADGKFYIGETEYTAKQLLQNGYSIPEQYLPKVEELQNTPQKYTTTNSTSYTYREPTESERAVWKQEDEEAQKRYGVVVDENGNISARDNFLTDILGIDPEVVKQEDERKLRQAEMRRKSANLYQSLMLLNDIVGGLFGGTIQERKPSTKAKDAADSIDKLNEDVIKREQDWKQKEKDAIDAYNKWHEQQEKDRRSTLKETHTTQTSDKDYYRHLDKMRELDANNAARVKQAQIRAEASKEVARIKGTGSSSSGTGSSSSNVTYYQITDPTTGQSVNMQCSSTQATKICNQAVAAYKGVLNRLRREKVNTFTEYGIDSQEYTDANNLYNAYVIIISDLGCQVATRASSSGVYNDKWTNALGVLNYLIPYDFWDNLTSSEQATFKNIYNTCYQYNGDTPTEDEGWEGSGTVIETDDGI